MDKNYSFFMKADLSPYLDEWIAIVDERVVSHGRDFKSVFDAAKRAFPLKRPLIAKVPGAQTMIL